ncbi:MAG: GGDEF domain-containing protein, partial [Turicibacter sp.]
MQNQSKSKIDTELFSADELEWLYASKRTQVNTGYPSSITPLNYFYYSSISKGVIMDISTEFYHRTLKGFSSLPITDVNQNKDLVNKGVIDILVTGKRTEYGDLYYSSPIQEFEYSFFTKANSDVKLVEQLEEQKVGIVNNDDKITSYLNVINDKIEIVEYPNFIDLYKALAEQEIVSIFVPKELMVYQNLNANLSEIKLSDFTVSSWYFASNDEMLIRILDKIMTVISTDELYANHFLKHQNALNSKLYNFDKLTHEWLFYQNPVVKVGIYDIPAFMTYDKDSLSVNGMGGYIFNQLSSQFGIKFEFIYDTYANLLDAYLDKNIDLLPVFNYDLSTDITEDRLGQEGNLYTIYQGEINAYGNYSIPYYEEESKKNRNLDVGTIILPSIIDSEYRFNEMVLFNEKTIGSAVKSLKSGTIDYLFLDPNYLNYFNDYELSPKG